MWMEIATEVTQCHVASLIISWIQRQKVGSCKYQAIDKKLMQSLWKVGSYGFVLCELSDVLLEFVRIMFTHGLGPLSQWRCVVSESSPRFRIVHVNGSASIILRSISALWPHVMFIWLLHGAKLSQSAFSSSSSIIASLTTIISCKLSRSESYMMPSLKAFEMYIPDPFVERTAPYMSCRILWRMRSATHWTTSTSCCGLRGTIHQSAVLVFFGLSSLLVLPGCFVQKVELKFKSF